MWNGRRHNATYDGNIKHMNVESIDSIVQGYDKWRKQSKIREEISYKSASVEEFDYYEIEYYSDYFLQPNKDYFIIMHSFSCYQSLKLEPFWRRFANEITTIIPNIVFG